MLDDFLQGWPDVPPLVVRETATQHDVSWRDASTSTDRQAFNAAVQAGPPTLSAGIAGAGSMGRTSRRHAGGSSVRSCRPVPPGGVAGPDGSRGAEGAAEYGRCSRLSGPADNGSAAAASALWLRW